MTVKELIGLLRTLDQKKEVLVAVNVDYAGMPCWDCREIFNVDDKGREILIKGKINALEECGL